MDGWAGFIRQFSPHRQGKKDWQVKYRVCSTARLRDKLYAAYIVLPGARSDGRR